MTSRFELQLLPDDPANIEGSRERIRQEVIDFQSEYNSTHPKQVDNQEVVRLFQSLGNGRYWNILASVDGYANAKLVDAFRRQSPADHIREKQQARLWGRRTFGDGGLETLLNLAVNVALLQPYGEGPWPGLAIPHSILYHELVEKTDSIFSGAVGPELKTRLNNGRFWEELAEMWYGLNNGFAYKVVGNVLEATPELDISFAPRGFRIFHARRAEVKEDQRDPAFDLTPLRNRTIDLYFMFVQKLQASKDELGISESDIAYLVAPYVVALTGETPYQNPRFDGKSSPHYTERLRHPVVNHYLNSSEHVRSVLAHKLESELCYHSNKSIVRDVIASVDDPLTFVGQMMFNMKHQDDASKMIAELKRMGIDLVIPELATRPQS